MTAALHAWTSYLAAASAAVALFLFLRLRRTQREFEVRWRKRQQSAQTEMGRLRGDVAALAGRVEEAERRAELMAAPYRPATSINMNRRAEAIRLHQRGETAPQIAASLTAPLPEIELILKAHRIRLEAKQQRDLEPVF